MDKLNFLYENLSHCKKCLHCKNKKGIDCSLINIYQDRNFCTKIPSIWTDWKSRLSSDIFIIGQDWGPYCDMKALHEQYIQNESSENWTRLINQEKSLTKKNLEKFFLQSAQDYCLSLVPNFLDYMYITNAILCARTGTNYRENNILLKESTLNCLNNLKKQIDIVHPKIILTLGYYPLFALSKIYHFEISKNLTTTIQNSPVFFINDFIIIPLFHPAAQISNKIQLEQYHKIWKYYKPQRSTILL